MLVAAVAAGQGFALLTPTLLLDGVAEGMAVTWQGLPGPGFSRTITLVGRAGEFGDLPGRLAGEMTAALRGALEARLEGLPEGAVSYAGEGG